jgi:hypothetical protein
VAQRRGREMYIGLWKRHLKERHRQRWENNNKMDLTVRGWREHKPDAPGSGRGKWQALVYMVTKPSVPCNEGNFLTTWEPVASQEGILLCYVCYIISMSVSQSFHLYVSQSVEYMCLWIYNFLTLMNFAVMKF